MATSDTELRSGRAMAQVGQRAPDFTLPNQGGTAVRLADLFGQGPIVLYFYPKDESALCTAEACAFRDSYAVFKDVGAEVVGVSTDSVASHQQFAHNHRLPFMLLSDPGGKVRTQYGATMLFGLLKGRVTYILDKHGIVRHTFNSLLNTAKHVDEALAVVKQLQTE